VVPLSRCSHEDSPRNAALLCLTYAYTLCTRPSSQSLLTPAPRPPLPLSARRQFETFSYLPPLTADQISRQVDYIVENGWTPCLEFAEERQAYVSSESTVRFGAVSAVSSVVEEGNVCGGGKNVWGTVDKVLVKFG